ncbi:MAG: mannose-1-phosphate guanylyltransferase [Flavobacteriaceae bacterium]|nr:MAG: mannose-1-phosphate guanylyltransferase [Flavobacteriaceae bacterium]
MAGGVGTRFWPMSLNAKPKQFHDILGVGKSFLQQTYQRALDIVPKENVLILGCLAHKKLILEQLPELNESQVVLEPTGRDTAPCNLYAAMKIAQKNPDALMLILPSDHMIEDQKEFVKNIDAALSYAKNQDRLITIGIKPTHPNTGYGYIQYVLEDKGELKKVKTFTEKPTLEFAESFLASGDFLWNSGMFVWSCKAILKAYQSFLPSMYQQLEQVDFNTENEASQILVQYEKLQKISIDYGIMENAENTYVIPSDFGWSDIGTWTALYDVSKKDVAENAILSKNVRAYNLERTIVKNTENKLMIIDGLEDYIVVNTDRALLICPKSKDQEIKNYVNDLKLNKLEDYV